MKMKWPEWALKWKGALGKYRYALLVAAVGVVLLALPSGSQEVQPEETADRLDREVFSVENAAHEKPGEKVLPQRPEDPARVTEEELQALLQELLTV